MNFKEINSIILFGSFSTGDINEDSDIDICIITIDNPKELINQEELLKFYNIENNREVSLVTYPDSTIKKMLEFGSLFLWHLHYEGKVLYGKEYFDSQIRNLKKYKGHLDEMKYIREIFNDLISSFNYSGVVTNFDFSLLFSLVRNSCITLTDKLKSPKFGKKNCFILVKSLFPEFPLNFQEYQKLYDYKIIYERDNKNISGEIDLKDFDKYAELVNLSIEFCFDKINA